MFGDQPPLSELQATLADVKSPVAKSMRAAYYLRSLYDKTDDPKTKQATIDTLSSALLNKESGALLRHEYAYVLGQMRDSLACKALEATLCDIDNHVMVRHECGEALGAIASLDSLDILRSCMEEKSALVEVVQTCEVAVNFIEWQQKGEQYETSESAPVACACMISPYDSTDPAPPSPAHVNVPTAELGAMLRNSELELFERYKCMFSLRNRGGEESVKELGVALVQDQSSALMRHEIAYVLGQMQHSACVEDLEASLRREGEHEMVRHEAAEALGAIEGRWEDCEKILNEFLNDYDQVVRESCAVALDAAEYFNNFGNDTNSADDGDANDKVKDNSTKTQNFQSQKASLKSAHFNVKA